MWNKFVPSFLTDDLYRWSEHCTPDPLPAFLFSSSVKHTTSLSVNLLVFLESAEQPRTEEC